MFFTIEQGNCPLIITVPHDGEIKIAGAATRAETQRWERETGFDGRDYGTLEIARACNRTLARHDCTATLLIETLHRAHVDVNRHPICDPYVQMFGDEYRSFHATLQMHIAQTVAQHGTCLLVDLHGYEFSPGPDSYDMVFGSDSHRTCPHGSDRRIAEFLKEYQVVFSPDRVRNVDSRYRGGWIVRSVARQWSSQRVDAVQIEINTHLRQSAQREEVAYDLAQALHFTLQVLG